MILRPPRSKRTYPLFPYTTRVRCRCRSRLGLPVAAIMDDAQQQNSVVADHVEEQAWRFGDRPFPDAGAVDGRANSRMRLQLFGRDNGASQQRDRKCVVWGKSVSVREELGGRRIITTKTTASV